MARKKSPSQLDREIAEVLSGGSGKVKLKDRYSGGHAWLTFRGGRVVGAMGSDPKRYVGLTVGEARHHARYGGKPRRGSSHATKRGAADPIGAEWDDLAPTGIRVQAHSGDMPLEDATPVEIRRDMNRRLAGFRALSHVPARRKKWALAVYELAQAKPWVMDQVPHDVWGLVLADVGRGTRSSTGHATKRGAGVEVDTSVYRRTHGAEPRGSGNWKFVIGAREYAYGDESDLYRPAESRGAYKAGRPQLSFAKAKEHAIAEAKRRGVTVVGVAP